MHNYDKYAIMSIKVYYSKKNFVYHVISESEGDRYENKKLKSFGAFLMSAFMIVFIMLPDTALQTDAAALSFGVSSSMSSRYIGGTIKVTAEVSGGTAPYYYKFLYKVDNGS